MIGVLGTIDDLNGEVINIMFREVKLNTKITILIC